MLLLLLLLLLSSLLLKDTTIFYPSTARSGREGRQRQKEGARGPEVACRTGHPRSPTSGPTHAPVEPLQVTSLESRYRGAALWERD